MPKRPTRARKTGGKEPSNQIEASRWLAGPDGDPLHELPWFARPGAGRQAGRPAKVPRRLKRPQRFQPVTMWVRVRNSIALVGVGVCIWLAVLGIRAISAELAGGVPGRTHPTPAATNTGTPQPHSTPTGQAKP